MRTPNTARLTGFSIRFAPETGSTKPYELIWHWSNGDNVHRGSFKTEKAARKAGDERFAESQKHQARFCTT